MRRFKYIDTKENAWKYYPKVPKRDRIYSEDVPYEKELLDYWKTSIHFEVEFEEVFESSNLQASPDLFEAYLEGVIDVYEASDTSTQSMGMLKRILEKYRGFKGK